jgi:hypothetical protein
MVNVLSTCEIREVVRKVLESPRVPYKQHSPHDRLTAQDIDDLFQQFISSKEQLNEAEVSTHLSQDLDVAHLHVLHATLFMMAVGAVMSKSDFKCPLPIRCAPTAETPDNPNATLALMLGQVVNHSLAVIRLVRSGFEGPARMTLRSTHELCAKTIVITADEKRLTQFLKARTQEEARKAWNKYFKFDGKGPDTLLACLEGIERKQGLPTNMIDSMKRQRSQLYGEYSGIVHHSADAIRIHGFPLSIARLQTSLGVGGTVTPYSIMTLCDLSFLLQYYVFLMVSLLEDNYNIERDLEDTPWYEVAHVGECAFAAFGHLLEHRASYWEALGEEFVAPSAMLQRPQRAPTEVAESTATEPLPTAFLGVMERDDAGLATALASVVDVNTVFQGGVLLNLALKIGTDESVRLILERKPDPDALRTRQRPSALMCAIAYQRDWAVPELLAIGADVNYTCGDPPTNPITLAVRRRQLDVLRLLAKHGAEVDCEMAEKGSARGLTPLICAAHNGDVELVLALVGCGADVNYYSQLQDLTPLAMAALSGRMEVARALVEKGARRVFFHRKGGSQLVRISDIARRAGFEEIAIFLENVTDYE